MLTLTSNSLFSSLSLSQADAVWKQKHKKRFLNWKAVPSAAEAEALVSFGEFAKIADGKTFNQKILCSSTLLSPSDGTLSLVIRL